eukprot:CAMPEP_0197035346 /NCGR_PEP_ID=MMETSP1384-20130603/13180_1 /TAXON_ID=29189 /ORGANISM="Ammonia sp." /LENGTH=473 /DNA_ID=CAMNT_0042465401 /DNA_START=175 /DNA_END=1596 /DNA_ORIENTATION=+
MQLNTLSIVQCIACYMLLYWFVVVALTIIVPRYTLEDFKQPQDCVVEESKRVKCGLLYYLERDSPSTELFDKLAQTGDAMADDLWPDLLKLVTQKNLSSKAEVDPLDILLENVNINPKFKRFVDKLSELPSWANLDDLSKATKFHQRLSLPFSYVLAICTLVGGFGCPEINKVLISSRYWANHNDSKSLRNTLNRLRETSIWLFSVMRDATELKPFGAAWKSILRVRLFHAKVRYQLSIKKKARAETTATTQEMVPINQVHLIGTLLGFQYTPLVVMKTIFGIPINDQELERYTALWRYIGFVLGCVEWNGDDEAQREKCVPLESFAMSRAWMSRVWDYLINPDINEGVNSTTMMLSQHVLKSIALTLSEKTVGKIFSLNEQTIEAFFRAFLTEEYADMVKLAAIHWSYELQIRVIIAHIRIVCIVAHQLHLNWLLVLVFGRVWYQIMRYMDFEVLQKKEKYHCRFTKYCGFA